MSTDDDRLSEREAHPEDYCHRCGITNISWFTPGAVWDPVMRPDADGTWLWEEIICPLCFGYLDEQLHGEARTWTLLPTKDDGGPWTSADERADIIRRAKAEALREAAGDWSDWDALDAPEDWLRDRADRLDQDGSA